MHTLYNVYCDESCHLPLDGERAMVLGAVWCPYDKAHTIFADIREIKRKHGLAPEFEIKWTKISPAKSNFYVDLINYFFENDDLHFRAVVVPNKGLLDHGKYNQSHDDWYYKMYYTLLTPVLNPRNQYRIFLDIKDTRGNSKIRKLCSILETKLLQHESAREVLQLIQLTRSHEILLMQLTDILIGAVGYKNRHLSSNSGKMAVVSRIHDHTGYSLTANTMLSEDKFNLLLWRANNNEE